MRARSGVRSGVSSVAVALVMVVAASCSSSKSASGTGGSGSGGRGGTTGTGGNGTGGASSGTGGTGTGGASSSTGGTGTGGASSSTGGVGAGGTSGGGAGGALTCGPFANGGAGGLGGAGGVVPSPTMSFFVSSQTNMTGNLGGLAGADQRCLTLATAVGMGTKTWHAYLSVEHDPANAAVPINARDRIGAGPWFNARGVMVAANLATLHSRTGDAAIFLDEHGGMIKGQWTGSLTPIEHDILTGSNADGTVAVGKTCVDWTSEAGPTDAGPFPVARVGHTDGLGPMCSMATTPNDVTSWNSAHDNMACNDTAPRGGAGRIYCFAVN